MDGTGSGGSYNNSHIKVARLNNEMQIFFNEELNATWISGTTIWRMNLDGSNQTKVFNDAFSRWAPAVSPDGSKLAYVRRSSDRSTFWVALSNLDGSNEQTVYELPAKFIRVVNWSPDGKKLLFVQQNDGEFSGDVRDGDVFVINTDGTGLTNLTNSWDYNKWYASFSPDGQKICYTGNATTWYAWPQHLYVMNADGSGKTQLTSYGDGDQNKVWECIFSSNSSSILLSKGDTFRKINVDGSNDQAIGLSSGGQPRYFDNDNKIVFGQLVNGIWQIATANADGSNVAVLTNSTTGFVNPAVGTSMLLPAVPITVTTTPEGLAITVDGATYTSPRTFTWAAGSRHTIGVPVTTVAPGTRRVFASWSDSGSASHTITTPASDTTYTAATALQYQLTTAVNPAGTGVASPATGAWYAPNTVVPVKAFPNSGYGFISWAGPVAGSASATTSVTMSGPATVTATMGGQSGAYPDDYRQERHNSPHLER